MPKKPYTGYLTLWNSGKRWALLSPRTHLREQGIPKPRARTPKSGFPITELWRRRACENCCKSRSKDIRGNKSGFEERCLLIQSGHLGLQPLNRPGAALWPITRIRKYAVLPPHTVPLRRNMSTAPSMCSVYIPAFANKAALLRRAALFYHFAPPNCRRRHSRGRMEVDRSVACSVPQRPFQAEQRRSAETFQPVV